MANVKYIEYEKIGKGIRIESKSLSLAGLLVVLQAARGHSQSKFRYSLDGGLSFTDWKDFSFSEKEILGKLTETIDIIVDFVNAPVSFEKQTIIPFADPLSSVIYDKTVFKTFFDSNDPQVLAWAVNVLEKLFEPGIVPLYVNRDNENDYNTFFFTITHFFAFIVVYARQFRKLENSDLLMKEFIEGWGLVYENINTLEQRQYLFRNWIEQFRKRGTLSIIETGEVIEGELRRLVGYTAPSEFIFGVLAPQDVGWCLGYSSPTWHGTETINAVSKGYDFGPDYSGDKTGDLISFGSEEVVIPSTGGVAANNIFTNFSWEILLEGDPLPPNYLPSDNAGVGPLSDYPILGSVDRIYKDDMYVLRPTGEGACGVSSIADPTKVMEIYMGLDYEVTVWVKAETLGKQNIDFGVNCYDGNKNFVKQVRITDWKETNSFMEGSQYQNPCKVPGIYYSLRGIIYNVTSEKQEELFLNFENGRPLRFIGDVSYLAPYIIQNREGNVANILIAGVVLKPLNLPFSQGYLGQKNVIAMYSQIKSARTRQDIETFVKRYLVSYKNVVSYTWLNWVQRTAWFLTFSVVSTSDGSKIVGALVTLSNGFESYTDEDGYVRFELLFDAEVTWTVVSKGVSQVGFIKMNKDYNLNVKLDVPLFVSTKVEPGGSGSIAVSGSKLGDGYSPDNNIVLTATNNSGWNFQKFVILPDKIEEISNPLTFHLNDHSIEVKAIFTQTFKRKRRK